MKLRDKKYPSKQMVNLAVYDKSVKGSRHMAPVLFLYLLFIVVFIRFFLLEPVKEMAESEAALSQKQEELLRCQEYNSDYYQVEERYRQYFGTYLTPEERALINRVQVLRLLEETVERCGVIETITIQGNTCQLVVAQTPLSGISELTEALEASPLIQHVTVSTAVARQYEEQNDISQTVTADMTIILTGGDLIAE